MHLSGIQEPRTGKYQELPSARAVSVVFFTDHDVESHVHTLMHMTFGQFLDHDLARTAVTKLTKTNDNGMFDRISVIYVFREEENTVVKTL